MFFNRPGSGHVKGQKGVEALSRALGAKKTQESYYMTTEERETERVYFCQKVGGGWRAVESGVRPGGINVLRLVLKEGGTERKTKNATHKWYRSRVGAEKSALRNATKKGL